MPLPKILSVMSFFDAIRAKYALVCTCVCVCVCNVYVCAPHLIRSTYYYICRVFKLDAALILLFRLDTVTVTATTTYTIFRHHQNKSPIFYCFFFFFPQFVPRTNTYEYIRTSETPNVFGCSVCVCMHGSCTRARFHTISPEKKSVARIKSKTSRKWRKRKWNKHRICSIGERKYFAVALICVYIRIYVFVYLF